MLRYLAAMAMAACLAGSPIGHCLAQPAGQIGAVALRAGTPTVCDPAYGYCGVSLLQPATFVISGRGRCDALGIEFGDGKWEYWRHVDFGDGSAPLQVTHKYTGAWPGPKSVHVFPDTTFEPELNCSGEARMGINVLSTATATPSVNFLLALRPTLQCAAIDTQNWIRNNTTVAIHRATTSRADFGCFLGGCIYDQAGQPGSHAPGNWPFPGFVKYSLIMKWCDTLVQGTGSFTFQTPATNATGSSFVTNPLRFCVNDDKLSDNSGGWGVAIFVDERGATEGHDLIGGGACTGADASAHAVQRCQASPSAFSCYGRPSPNN
jgi:hypothetical protein